jgi:hypothetical protein
MPTLYTPLNGKTARGSSWAYTCIFTVVREVIMVRSREITRKPLVPFISMGYIQLLFKLSYSLNFRRGSDLLTEIIFLLKQMQTLFVIV